MTNRLESAHNLLREGSALQRLTDKFRGRYARPLAKRLQLCSTVVYRDPRDVAWRWCKRFLKGTWYRGGSHVARLHGGNGIGFEGWVNDRRIKIKPVLIQGVQSQVEETRFVLRVGRRPNAASARHSKDVRLDHLISRMYKLNEAVATSVEHSVSVLHALHRRIKRNEMEIWDVSFSGPTRNPRRTAIIPYAGGAR